MMARVFFIFPRVGMPRTFAGALLMKRDTPCTCDGSARRKDYHCGIRGKLPRRCANAATPVPA